jgi:hypothetical protein
MYLICSIKLKKSIDVYILTNGTSIVIIWKSYFSFSFFFKLIQFISSFSYLKFINLSKRKKEINKFNEIIKNQIYQ